VEAGGRGRRGGADWGFGGGCERRGRTNGEGAVRGGSRFYWGAWIVCDTRSLLHNAICSFNPAARAKPWAPPFSVLPFSRLRISYLPSLNNTPIPSRHLILRPPHQHSRKRRNYSVRATRSDQPAERRGISPFPLPNQTQQHFPAPKTPKPKGRKEKNGTEFLGCWRCGTKKGGGGRGTTAVPPS